MQFMYNENRDHTYMYNDRRTYFIFFTGNMLFIFLINCAYNLKLIVCKQSIFSQLILEKILVR